jgi:hypothetical protein
MTNQEFLDSVIMSNYLGMTNKNLLLLLVDNTNKVLFATDLYAKFCGYTKGQDMKGLALSSLKCFSDEQLQVFMHRNRHVRKTKTSVEYLDTFANGIIWNTTVTPLISPDGEYLGYECLAREIDLDIYMDIFVSLHKQFPSVAGYNLRTKIDVSLTELQHQVLFLLIIGKSQYDIASLLNKSRNTIKSIITDGLYPKFAVEGSTETLIKRAISMGMHRSIPKSLIGNSSTIIGTPIDWTKEV